MIHRRGAVTALSVGGLGISSYLTLVRLTQERVPLICSASGLFNCEQVATSPESAIGPIPIAALGIVWFLVMLAIAGRLGPADGPLGRRVNLLWTVVGVLVVLYLIYAELFLIGALCAWCTAVHITVIALFLISVDAVAAGDPDSGSPANVR